MSGNVTNFVAEVVKSSKGTLMVTRTDVDDARISKEHSAGPSPEAISSGKKSSIGFDAAIAGQIIELDGSLPTVPVGITINGLGIDNTVIKGALENGGVSF